MPVLDRLAVDPLLDLRGDFLAAIGQLLQRFGGLQLRSGATAASTTPRGLRKLARLLHRAHEQLAGLLGQRQHLGLRLA